MISPKARSRTEDAADELRSAIDAIPDSDTVDQAPASLTPQVATLQEVINEAGETNCARLLIEAQAEEAAADAEATTEATVGEAAAAAEEAADAAERRARRRLGQLGVYHRDTPSGPAKPWTGPGITPGPVLVRRRPPGSRHISADPGDRDGLRQPRRLR